MVDWLIGETHVWWINHHDQDFYSNINLEEVKPFCLGRCQEHYSKKSPRYTSSSGYNTTDTSSYNAPIFHCVYKGLGVSLMSICRNPAQDTNQLSLYINTSH